MIVNPITKRPITARQLKDIYKEIVYTFNQYLIIQIADENFNGKKVG